MAQFSTNVSSSLRTPMTLTLSAAVSEMSPLRFLLSTACRNVRHCGQLYSTFEVVPEFIYLSAAVNSNNDISLEIKRRSTLANRCYYGLSKQLSSRALSRMTKLTLYKTLIIPVLLYGAEAWVVSQSDAAALGVFERKVLRKIFGPMRVGEDYCSRTNNELYELYANIDVVQRIAIQRLRWLGHVMPMDEEAPTKKVFEGDVQRADAEEDHCSGGKTRWRKPHARLVYRIGEGLRGAEAPG
ncbi:uncharacterized protein LOC128869602 [Anastrepha ludens]|uniref:uncharacterized protein LOC128869602 n=1 Tax=Anastrepha ludens TaxID=28586 RepID=UPI0023B13C11|nr:uncharacterized protein LOC128869602 [Anastrepha ludens]XP_053968150.1 uncharacterized protein LOC128869602 [Anastrepha ludens]